MLRHVRFYGYLWNGDRQRFIICRQYLPDILGVEIDPTKKLTSSYSDDEISSMFDFIVSIVGVLIFVGLTAYDANKAKRIAATSDSNNALAMSMYCALELYLDFINLFLRLLSLFGKRK